MLSGIVSALIASLFKSGKSLTAKAASTGTNEYVATFSMRLITGFILFVVAITGLTTTQLNLTPVLIGAIIVNTFLLGSLAVLSNRAYKLADTSLVAPLIGLTPIMSILPTVLLVDDTFTLLGIVGIFLTGIGGFIILSNGEFTISRYKKSLSNPGIKSVFIFLLFVGFIPPIDKIGVQNTSPLIWPFIINFSSGLFILAVATIFGKIEHSTITRRNIGVLLLFGVLNAGIWVGQSFAYEVMNPSYVQSIKRVSVIITVILGNNIYNEEYLLIRVTGSILIVLGILLLTLFG
jgi:uncharacterized membrane protein